jgi:hypothetical protein
MAERKRILKKRPHFRLPKEQQEEDDLKKVKAQTLKALEESELQKKEWYDKELEKNLKTP